MNKLLFKKLPSSQIIGSGLFNVNKIYRYSVDPCKVGLDYNVDNLFIETANYKQNLSLDPNTYVINCLIALNDGTIHPGVSTIQHIDSEKNKILNSLIISPDGLVPLHYEDEINDCLFVYNHTIIPFQNSDVFPSPFNRFYLDKESSESYKIIDSVPECLAVHRVKEPLTVEELASLPFDLTHHSFNIKGTEYFVRLRIDSEEELRSTQSEIPMLIKLANGIQSIAKVTIDLHTKIPLWINIIHDSEMKMLSYSNFRNLLGVNTIEEICPIQLFGVEFDEESHKTNLIRFITIGAETLTDILCNVDEMAKIIIQQN